MNIAKMVVRMSDKKMEPSAEVVLVGNGHCHLEVVRFYKSLDPKPYRLTLISQTSDGIYKGMLPRVIAGMVPPRHAFIDVAHLCNDSGVRFIKQEVTHIDLASKTILTQQKSRQIGYDALSLDVGSSPHNLLKSIPELKAVAIPCKPSRQFLNTLVRLEMTLKNLASEDKIHLVVEGGDLRAVEIMNAIATRIRKNQHLKNLLQLTFLDTKGWAQPFSEREWSILKKNFDALNVSYRQQCCIKAFDCEAKHLQLEGGEKIRCDHLILASCSQGHELLENIGLDVDKRGLMRVNPNLESSSHLGVYGAGSSAAWSFPYIRSQSLVYHSGMGSTLAQNLVRRFSGLAQLQCKIPYKMPIYAFLNPKKTLLKRGSWIFTSPSVRHYRDALDASWYQRYTAKVEQIRASTYIESGNIATRPCRGNADSLPLDLCQDLKHNLAWYKDHASASIFTQTSIKKIERAACSTFLVQSVGSLSAYTRDLFSFGKTAQVDGANHLFSLGVKPQSAQVVCTVPYGPKEAMSADVSELMAGVSQALSATDVELDTYYVHAGPYACLGLNIESFVNEEEVQGRAQLKLKEHHCLILTKPLGTGIMFAGYDRFKVASRHMWKALEHMTKSHEPILGLFKHQQLGPLQAVAQFGLAGAIAELTDDDSLYASINLSRMPIYEGMVSAVVKGVRTSLHSQNRIPYTRTLQYLSHEDRSRAEFLFDPQTSGPILIAVDADIVEEVLGYLHAHGFQFASMVGMMRKKKDPTMPVVYCDGH